MQRLEQAAITRKTLDTSRRPQRPIPLQGERSTSVARLAAPRCCSGMGGGENHGASRQERAEPPGSNAAGSARHTRRSQPVAPVVPLVRLRVRREHDAEPFQPARVTVVDVAQPIPAVVGDDGPRYARGVTFVHWTGTPVGAVWIDLSPGRLDATSHAAAIWEQLGDDLRMHAANRGLGAVDPLTASGFGSRRDVTPHAATTPSVTVIVATHDRPKLLDRCLRSLLAVDYPAFDVVVVDNAPSSDATARLIAAAYADAPVTYVVEPERGLAIAHNRGLDFVSGEVVAFTDDDVIVDPGWLRSLAVDFADDDVACVTGLILPIRLDTQAQFWLEGYAGYAKGMERRSFDLGCSRPEDRLFPYTAGRLGSGANMAFRTEFLRSIGGFDPALGAGSPAFGGDDLAAFFEVITRGHTLVYEPAAIVHHDHPETDDALWRQVFGYGAGLTAYLTKTLLDHPAQLMRVLARAPQAVWYVLSSRSVRNAGRAADFPATLRLRELAGMAVGPVAYLRSRRRVRRLASRPHRGDAT